ncbi:PspC domain-containing protein [Geodermatophilus sp. YIM 151500]|uniref:ATP-binding protein n=1 Tax=Geodermatophilus sp. YIM 151500 TaxID=2984531 RepID=UPI0021E3DEAD|nr:ATP-binding protein [Geodermatophilus sp. YIM 151500]MCV2488469.1 PspC domain-containing protein [Geodermatophilus sp. YIM 151500]
MNPIRSAPAPGPDGGTRVDVADGGPVTGPAVPAPSPATGMASPATGRAPSPASDRAPADGEPAAPPVAPPAAAPPAAVPPAAVPPVAVPPSAAPPVPAPPAPPADRPPLVRPRSGRLLAGVASGTAAHLRLDPLVVRVAFVVLATTGIGVVAYALLWLTMPVADVGAADGAPGRTADHRPRSGRQVAGLGVLVVLAFLLVGQVSAWGGNLVFPLLLLVGGLAVIWRQLDTDRTLAMPNVRWALAGGVVLAAGGVVLLLTTTGQLAEARDGFAATLVILAGIALATAPLWRRLLDSRDAERAARIRSEERASVAAHLHDSVLQTLALIQRHSGSPSAVSRLARSQERELRAWLYEPAVVTGGTWAGLVAGMVADVENDHALTVDPVVVGDAPVDDALAALGAATREALVNAAKHSGAASADLYSEVTPDRVSVFVRDRGAGFDPAAVPPDRRGLRDSVTGRLSRLGGSALVRSAPGDGTEVELVLPRVAA